MQLAIFNDRLTVDGKPCAFVPSPHVGGRIEPSLILVHDTADRLKPEDSVSWFKNPKSKVSAHFVLGRDGRFTQMVDCDRAAWHAGKSSWCGRANCNTFAIGIEIDNPGPLKRKGDAGVAWFGESFSIAEYGLVEIETTAHGRALWLPYTPAQLAAIEALVRALAIAYPTITDVAAHFEVSPGRKVDVGPHFPLMKLRGILADRVPLPKEAVEGAQQRLAALGYHPGVIDGVVGVRTRAALRTFQEQNGVAITGAFDRATLDALASKTAKPIPTASRETTTKADLKAVSSTMRAASTVKRTAEAGLLTQIVSLVSTPDAASSPAVAAAPVVDILGPLSDAVTQVETNKGLAERVHALGSWLLSPENFGTALTIALLCVVWLYGHRAEIARWRDHVTGKNLGG